MIHFIRIAIKLLLYIYWTILDTQSLHSSKYSHIHIYRETLIYRSRQNVFQFIFVILFILHVLELFSKRFKLFFESLNFIFEIEDKLFLLDSNILRLFKRLHKFLVIFIDGCRFFYMICHFFHFPIQFVHLLLQFIVSEPFFNDELFILFLLFFHIHQSLI